MITPLISAGPSDHTITPQMTQLSMQLHSRVRFHHINLRKTPQPQEIVFPLVGGLVLEYPRKNISLRRVLIKMNTLWNKFEVNGYRNCNRIKFRNFVKSQLQNWRNSFIIFSCSCFHRCLDDYPWQSAKQMWKKIRRSLLDHLYIHCLLHVMTKDGCIGNWSLHSWDISNEVHRQDK